MQLNQLALVYVSCSVNTEINASILENCLKNRHCKLTSGADVNRSEYLLCRPRTVIMHVGRRPMNFFFQKWDDVELIASELK